MVDDYEPFRRVVCSLLVDKPELQIGGEVSDGLRIGSESRRTATGLDSAGYRDANSEWN
jgi:hypothetical protein